MALQEALKKRKEAIQSRKLTMQHETAVTFSISSRVTRCNSSAIAVSLFL